MKQIEERIADLEKQLEHYNKPVMSAPEAAEYIGISLWKLRELTRQNRLPHLRISPKRIVYPRRALDQYLNRMAQREDVRNDPEKQPGWEDDTLVSLS